ncbi:hypothetical protein AVEN_58520-1 [Araneus ventricosus]|uniref:Uncharacterized protein n=1 Tax=Araneus ventricosus TaxID=182803 RepID=A0A4Y2IAC8_ARAVE|nr:hypothetical protein AVEN_58520-1 [Araneus ventricosus]
MSGLEIPRATVHPLGSLSDSTNSSSLKRGSDGVKLHQASAGGPLTVHSGEGRGEETSSPYALRSAVESEGRNPMQKWRIETFK